MKTKYLSVLLVVCAAPAFLFATPENDRKIEAAAKASYNYNTVLDGHVSAKVNDGKVTLTGTVAEEDGEKTITIMSYEKDE